MKYQPKNTNKCRQAPNFTPSILALAILGFSVQAVSQEAPVTTDTENTDDIEVINVRGIKRSVMAAQEIRRNADTFVDAITATDIGALPDRSVLEAMQRIPGISIERFAAANDPDHFGVEGSGAVIRGLKQTRSEFNGRDSFTANSGRGLSFQDVPPELMGSVQVYKNQSADLIEGGIGGTVSLHTRLPFDSDDRIIALSGDMTYSDLSETAKPTLSAMFSDNWQTDAGKFGFLANLANSKLESRSDSLQSEVFVERNDLVDGQTVFTPSGGNFGVKNDVRERTGIAFAAQWESPDKRSLLTAQFLRSDATLAWTENTVSYQTSFYEDDGFTIRRESFPLDGAPEYEYDDSGTFVNGIITNTPAGGWRSNGADRQRVPVAADWGSPSIPQFGNTFQTSTRSKDQRTVVEDFALNYKFRPNDSWSHEFDFQYIDANTTDDDVTLFLGVQANQQLDLRSDVPVISLSNPWNGQESGFGYENNEDYFQTDSSYYWRSAMDHIERSEGDSVAYRYDTKYVFDEGFFTSVKAGVRYAKREQTVRFSAFNWRALSPIFFNAEDNPEQFNAAWLDLPEHASLASDVDNVYWNNHHRGGTINIPGQGYTLHPSLDLVQDYQNWAPRLSSVTKDWVPLSQRQIQNGLDANGNPTFEQLDGPFRPAESNTFLEDNTAVYVRVDFESDDYKYPFSGNIGLRYVEVTRETAGAVTYPNLIPNNPAPAGVELPLSPEIVNAYLAQQVSNGIYPDISTARNATENQWTSESINFLSNDARAFGNYGTSPLNDEYEDEFLLPSFNLKVELDDDVLMRFAVAKAIAYPDTGLLKNFANIGANIGTERSQPDANGDTQILTANIGSWTGNSGNPFLEPMESVQYDLALEWYFDDVSSFTATLFYKDLSNFFITGATNDEFTNNGVTQTVRVQKALNSGDGTMEGFELAYSQFFDFLPEPFNHLGMQANYTYIDAKGVPNSNLDNSSVDGRPGTNTNNTDIAFTSLPLEGQSRHTANMVLTYENDDVSARIAYNWRSDYLLTARDVIQPHYPIYNEDSGFLDASIFYNITEDIKIGIQGVNLSDEVTRTTMQTNVDGTRNGRSWFVNDRRYSLVVRALF